MRIPKNLPPTIRSNMRLGNKTDEIDVGSDFAGRDLKGVLRSIAKSAEAAFSAPLRARTTVSGTSLTPRTNVTVNRYTTSAGIDHARVNWGVMGDVRYNREVRLNLRPGTTRKGGTIELEFGTRHVEVEVAPGTHRFAIPRPAPVLECPARPTYLAPLTGRPTTGR